MILCYNRAMKRCLATIAAILLSAVLSAAAVDYNAIDSPLQSAAYSGRFYDIFSNPAALPLMEVQPGMIAVRTNIRDSFTPSDFGYGFSGVQDQMWTVDATFISKYISLTAYYGLEYDRLYRENPIYDVYSSLKVELNAAYAVPYFSFGIRISGGNQMVRRDKDINNFGDYITNGWFTPFERDTGSEFFNLGLGVKGAAIATVFSQTVSCVFAIGFLCSRNVPLRLRFSDMRLGRRRTWKIIALGTSGFTMGATNSIVQLVCNKCAFIWGGDLYVGVMTILNSVREIYSTVMNGIGSGASPVMSFNYGARNGQRTIKASNFTLVCTFTYSMIAWIIIILFPHAMAMLFTQDSAMIEASASALRIYFFGFFFMAFQTAGQQTFVALGKARQAVFFSLFRKVIIVVPLTIALPYAFGINGVMLAEPISNVIGGLAAYLSMRHLVMPELRAMEKS